jgi:hypothetical protein
LTLSVVLGKVKKTDYAKGLLELISGVAGVVPAATALTEHLKVAGAILDGVETLLKMGDQEALVGLRKELSPTIATGVGGTAVSLQSSYFALINQAEGTFKAEELFVKDGGLSRGTCLADAEPFRDADYVLYAVQASSERGDERALPFYDLWDQALTAAGRSDSESWKLATTSLAALYVALMSSPDLVRGQATRLFESFKNDLVDIHKTASALQSLGSVLASSGNLEAIERIVSLAPPSPEDSLFNTFSQALRQRGEGLQTLGPDRQATVKSGVGEAALVKEMARTVNAILEMKGEQESDNVN